LSPRIRLTAAAACDRVLRLNQRQQSLPGNHLIHLVEEQLAARFLALAQAFGVTECQLHGGSFNVCLMNLKLAGQRPALPSDFVQICSDHP